MSLINRLSCQKNIQIGETQSKCWKSCLKSHSRHCTEYAQYLYFRLRYHTNVVIKKTWLWKRSMTIKENQYSQQTYRSKIYMAKITFTIWNIRLTLFCKSYSLCLSNGLKYAVTYMTIVIDMKFEVNCRLSCPKHGYNI